MWQAKLKNFKKLKNLKKVKKISKKFKKMLDKERWFVVRYTSCRRGSGKPEL